MASCERLGATLGRFGRVQGRPGDILGRIGYVLKRLGAILGPSWSLLGAVWEPFWRHQGGLMGRLRAFLGVLALLLPDFRTKLRHSILDAILDLIFTEIFFVFSCILNT